MDLGPDPSRQSTVSDPVALAREDEAPISKIAGDLGVCESCLRDWIKAACDDAGMESFFALPQKNVLNRRRRTTGDQLRQAIVAWIEQTHHHRRRQARLGRLTPVEFETIYTVASAA